MSTAATTHPLTSEQQAVVDAAVSGSSLRVQALAGAGKTSTLYAIAAAMPEKSILYLAFNKSIVTEAERKMPGNVACRTAHGLAYRTSAAPYRHRLTGGGRRLRGQEIARALRAEDVVVTLKMGQRRFAGAFLAGLAKRTVDRFCFSDDQALSVKHVPLVPGLEDGAPEGTWSDAAREVAKAVLPLAVRYWDDVQKVNGVLPFAHDHYLKMFHLSRPALPYDVILYDEAQDANPCMSDLVARQTGSQVIVVGDTFQQIYAWRGAENALARFPFPELWMTQSFRFGPAIAAVGGLPLVDLAAPVTLRGFDPVPSTVEALDTADAVLCRTNAGVLSQLHAYLSAGSRVAVVGGVGEVQRQLRAVIDLQSGRRTDHPDLACFATWGEVEFYVETEACGEELAALVRLVEKHDPATLLALLDRVVSDEDRADVVLSTAHKAKGREWDRVKLGTDYFDAEARGFPTPVEELRLMYVAATRARRVLDPFGCAYFRTALGPSDEEAPAAVPAPAAAPDAPAHALPSGKIDRLTGEWLPQ